MRKSGALVHLAGLILAGFAGGTSAQDAMFIDSSGNVGIGTNTPSTPVHVFTSQNFGIRAERTDANSATALLHLRNNGFPLFRFEDTSTSLTWDFRLVGSGDGGFAATRVGSGVLEFKFENDGDLFTQGSVFEVSSRASKDNIVRLDEGTVLNKLDRLPISEWSYTDDLSVRHVGPMAEDFYATFGLGVGGTHIATKDLAGVALAATKALRAENQALRGELAKLRKTVAELKSAVESN